MALQIWEIYAKQVQHFMSDYDHNRRYVIVINIVIMMTTNLIAITK